MADGGGLILTIGNIVQIAGDEPQQGDGASPTCRLRFQDRPFCLYLLIEDGVPVLLRVTEPGALLGFFGGEQILIELRMGGLPCHLQLGLPFRRQRLLAPRERFFDHSSDVLFRQSGIGEMLVDPLMVYGVGNNG